MKMRRLIQSLEEAMKAVPWRMPTDKEINEEWETEHWIEMLFDTHRNRMGRNAADGEALAKHIRSLKPVDVTHDKIEDTYEYNTLEELIKYHKHMGKNIQGIKDAMDAGKSLPYPLIMKKENGTLKALGGRHRMAVAKMFGYTVKALILDESKIKMQTAERIKEAYMDGSLSPPDATKDPDWKARRKEVVKWINAGANGNPPKLKNWMEAMQVSTLAMWVTGRDLKDTKGWFGSDEDED